MYSVGPISLRICLVLQSTSTSSPSTVCTAHKTPIITAPASYAITTSNTGRYAVEFLNLQHQAIEFELAISVTGGALNSVGSAWPRPLLVPARVVSWSKAHRDEITLGRTAAGRAVLSCTALRYRVSGYPTWSVWHAFSLLIDVTVV
jgi:hypothetical protein